MNKIMSSMGIACLVMTIVTAGGVALAQELPGRDLPTNNGAGIRSGNITATGETVPNPGVPQSAGTTSMDRGIEEQDNKIQSGICKGC